jgi:hypothetical protein
MYSSFRSFQFLFIILFLCSCTTYQRYQLPSARLSKINEDYLSYYLVDAAHPLSQVWYMSKSKVEDTAVTCYITKMTELEAAEVTTVRNKKDARWSKNDVLFYADPAFAASLKDTLTLTIPVAKFEKIEVYELNHIKSIGAPMLGVVGLFVVLFIISGG